MSLIVNGVEVSQAKLARIANITPYTLRSNIRLLLNMLLENGWTLKKGVDLVR